MMTNRYTHNFFHKVVAMFGLLLTFSSGTIPVVVTISTLMQFFLGQKSDFTLILVTSIFCLTPVIGCVFYSRYADIELLNEGLRVQLLPFWWKTVLWEEILDVQAVLPFFVTRAIVVERLTPFHRFLGAMYIAGLMHGFKPIFFISPTMHDYRELLAIIKEKIGVVLEY